MESKRKHAWVLLGMVIAFVLCAQVLGARSVWAEPQAESNLLENVEITAGGYLYR